MTRTEWICVCILLAGVVLLLTGCGSVPPAPAPSSAAPHETTEQTCASIADPWERHKCRVFWGLEAPNF